MDIAGLSAIHEVHGNLEKRVMTTAFVFSGGASLGSVQVGMAQALEDEGIRPDLIVGTSVGAINGACLAGGGSAAELADVWRSINRRQMFPMRPLLGLRAFIGKSTHYVPDYGLRKVLRRNIAFKRIEDAKITLRVIATDARTGTEVILSQGNAINAIVASAALPGVFAPVTIDGRTLIDGGIANNTPITTAILAGATEVWVLSTGYSCALEAAPKTALAMMMHAAGLLVQQRLVLETTGRIYPVPVWLIPPPCPITVTPVDFSQTEELMTRAREETRRWLNGSRRPSVAIPFPHDHF